MTEQLAGERADELRSGQPMSAADAEQFRADVMAIAAAINTFIQGKEQLVELALVCLLAEGHLLLEDVPGVGKTSLARALAGALGAPWQRIQFTPDLLPGDVTGISVFHQDSNSFVFHPGPVFANVVLADEINRASPRTQSALLEVMEERTVTVDGRAHHVPRPFLVVATQNPIEMDGTYPLPEAQIDRFLMKTSVGYPELDAEVRVLAAEHAGARVGDVPRAATAADVERLVQLGRTVHVASAVMDYIARLVQQTRVTADLRLGASPRGALALLRTSRVRAALHGRPHVVPGDVQALATPVLAHRVLPSAGAEAAGIDVADVIGQVIASVVAPPVDDRQ